MNAYAKKYFFILTFFVVIITSQFYLSKNTVYSKTYYAMGTNLTIKIAEKKFDKNVFESAFSKFIEVENLFKTKPNLNNEQVNNIYKIALELEEYTNGVFSPFLGSVIKLWQFDKENKTITKAPSNNQIQKALNEKSLNLYAIAKGYGIDVVAKHLKKQGINNFIVNAGGDLFVSGNNFGKQWVIGINNDKHSLFCNENSYAIATSSNLYNSYTFNGKKYGHLLNGKTGMPVEAEKSISVIANNATNADGLATAIFVDEKLIDNMPYNNISVIKEEKDDILSLNFNHKCELLK